MTYVFVSYIYSPDFKSPYSWFKRTMCSAGVMEQLSETDTVINIKQIDFEGVCLHHGVQYHFINANRKRTNFPRRFNHYIKNLNPDVVVIHGLHHPLQIMQLRLLLNKKTRIIAQHHAEQPFTGIKKRVQRFADRYVDAYLFASKPMGLGWVKQGNLGKAGKVHEVMEVSSVFKPIDHTAALLKTGVNGQPAFLWVGRLNANKDPLNVVKAFLKYVDVQPGAKLYMIYQTDELLGEIQAVLADNPNHKSSIILIGKIPHDQLLYWFNSADYIISGSFYEGSGTAVCEGMSCGCVPIVTDIDSFRMITNNGKCGILYEAGNEAALLWALNATRHINLPETRERIFRHYHTTLSFSAIAGRFREIGTMLSS